MRASTWPNPPELLTEEVAQQVASAIWTYDGHPYARFGFRGACGPELCGLDVGGGSAFADPDHHDLVVFELTKTSGQVRVVTTDQHGYPPELDAELDRLAHQLLTGSELEGRLMVGAVWFPPPDFGQFEVFYKAGDDRDMMLLRLDLPGRRVISISYRPNPEA